MTGRSCGCRTKNNLKGQSREGRRKKEVDKKDSKESNMPLEGLKLSVSDTQRISSR